MPGNAEILREIDSCAFIVCLDAGRPESIVDFSRATWHGGVNGEELGNRWYVCFVGFFLGGGVLIMCCVG